MQSDHVLKASRTQAINATHFDSVATEYDHEFGLGVDCCRPRIGFMRSHAEREIRVGRALDLGCGTGHLTTALLKEGLATSCIGLDISRGMVSYASAHGLRCANYMVGDATCMPFADQSFDLVVGDAFLHHVLDVAACLAEVRRVLKPGGVATFNEPWRDGYAFVELLFRTVHEATGEKDQGLHNYLSFLTYMREHAGDLDALARYPLPDKHHFTAELVGDAAESAGFLSVSVVPSIDYYPDCWHTTVKGTTAAVRPSPDVERLLLSSAAWVDKLIAPKMIEMFCPHVQIYFYA